MRLRKTLEMTRHELKNGVVMGKLNNQRLPILGQKAKVKEPKYIIRVGEDLMVVASPQMCEIVRILALYAGTDMVVTIVGEPGVGKGLLAAYLHILSDRRHRKMVTANCAAVSENLTESEYFGHKKGSFSQAFFNHKGFFQQANGSTLFLDEITVPPIWVQAKLLRAIETGWIRPVGFEEEIHVDCRIVTATNVKLEDMVAAGQFREDLYWRINEIPIYVPPLRERKEDIAVLINVIIDDYCVKNGSPRPQIDREALHALISYDWPGNVRQLKTTVKRAARECSCGTITLRLIETLLNHIRGSRKDLKKKLAQVERQEMVGAIIASGSDLEAAESINYSTEKFKNKKRHYGIHSRSIRKILKGLNNTLANA